MKPRFFIPTALIGIIFAVMPAVRATGIVAFHRADSITLAADSSGFDADGNLTSERVCKIIPGQRVAMTFAGEAAFTFIKQRVSTGAVESKEVFNAFDIARRVVQRATSVADAERLFQEEGPSYLKALAVKRGPASVALQILIAGFEQGQATLLIIDLIRDAAKSSAPFDYAMSA